MISYYIYSLSFPGTLITVLHPPSLVHLSILHHFVTPSPSLPSSILHPSSTFPSSVTLSLHHPHPLITSFHILVFQLLASPFCSILISYLHNIHSLLLASPFQLHLLYILSIVTLWVIFCILCTTLSLVVYKSFWLVVYSLACNCCPLLFAQSPLSLPLVSYGSPPWQYNLLVSPCLTPSKLRTTLFLSESTNT